MKFKSSKSILSKPLKRIAINYYMTDPISRASVTMAKCVKALEADQAKVLS
jgi:hypothetical protein